MPLDDATTTFLAGLAKANATPMYELTPTEARAVSAARREKAPPGPDMARVENVDVPSAAGPVPVRILVPHAGPAGADSGPARGVIVYLHGGGWVIGSIDGSDALGRTIAERTGCAVVMVDYRLAPEHPHPAAVDDSWAALRWTADRVADIAGADVPLVVAGDSAGGNLAAIVALRARDEGGPALGAQVLVYPVTNCDIDGPCYVDEANQLMLTRRSMIWFWNHYLPDVSARTRVDVSPARAADLAGLPPAVVLTAQYDVLRDEGDAYADRLRAAGVPVAHRRFAGQMHGFFGMVGQLPGSVAGIDYLAESLDPYLRKLPTSPDAVATVGETR